MLSKDIKKVFDKIKADVLILVLMEYALEDPVGYPECLDILYVLILVLMEYALEDGDVFQIAIAEVS